MSAIWFAPIEIVDWWLKPNPIYILLQLSVVIHDFPVSVEYWIFYLYHYHPCVNELKSLYKKENMQ